MWYQVSKFEVWKNSCVGPLEPWFTKFKSVRVRLQKIFYQTSNFDILDFVSPLRHKDAHYLISNTYIFFKA